MQRWRVVLGAAGLLLSVSAYAQTFDFDFRGTWNFITGDYELMITNTGADSGNAHVAIYKFVFGCDADGFGGDAQLNGQMTPVNYLNTSAEINAAYSLVTLPANDPFRRLPVTVSGKDAYSIFDGSLTEYTWYDTQVYSGRDGYVNATDLALAGETLVIAARERFNRTLTEVFPSVFHVSVVFGNDNDTTNNVFYPFRIVTKEFVRDEVFEVIPEPASMTALAVGLAALATRFRRRK